MIADIIMPESMAALHGLPWLLVSGFRTVTTVKDLVDGGLESSGAAGASALPAQSQTSLCEAVEESIGLFQRLQVLIPGQRVCAYVHLDLPCLSCRASKIGRGEHPIPCHQDGHLQI